MPQEGLRSIVDRGKRLAVRGRDLGLRALSWVGFTHSESRISADSQRYWAKPGGDGWEGNSHWRAASPFSGNDLWSRMGREHLALFERATRMVGFTRPWERVVEWGCGGGVNAVHFAPKAGEFVGVDISRETLDECAKEVAAVCDTPFRPVAIDVARPEEALGLIGGKCDVFLCTYVFELLPTPEYGARILRIARELLAPDGIALIQVKYDDGDWTTRSRRRSYTTSVADMTTYPISSFWQMAAACGFTPEMVHLVPKNELDERYAYFALTNDSSATREVAS